MKKILMMLAALLTMDLGTAAQVFSPDKPYGPLPSKNQLRWQEMEMYAFIHYSLNGVW